MLKLSVQVWPRRRRLGGGSGWSDEQRPWSSAAESQLLQPAVAASRMATGLTDECPPGNSVAEQSGLDFDRDANGHVSVT